MRQGGAGVEQSQFLSAAWAQQHVPLDPRSLLPGEIGFGGIRDQLTGIRMLRGRAPQQGIHLSQTGDLLAASPACPQMLCQRSRL
jgi:hypothetical protein